LLKLSVAVADGIDSEEIEENSDKTVYHWLFAGNIQPVAVRFI